MQWRRAALGALAMLPVLTLLGYGMTLDPRSLPSTLPGKPAPAFALDVLEGTEGPGGERAVSLAAHRGEVVVLNFWASWCLACRGEHSTLSVVASQYQGKGVRFYGAAFNDTPADAARYIRMMGGQTYPALLDPGTRTAIDYGVAGVPETFFIGRDGKVAYKHIGPVTEEVLVEWIERLRNQPEGS